MTNDELIEAWRHAFYTENGKLLWKSPSKFSSQKPGDEAGTLHTGPSGKQYRRVMFRREHHLVHRIVFALVHGYLPEEIDHIDGDGLNNYPENLRAATRDENARNVRMKTNKSGYTGVCWRKDCKKYQAQITADRKNRHLGMFDDPIEAAKAYDKAAREYHGEFATLNFPEKP